jgi:hypothetical protein
MNNRSIYIGFIIVTSLMGCSDLPQRDIEQPSVTPDANMPDADGRVPRSSLVAGLSVDDYRKVCAEVSTIPASQLVMCPGIQGNFERGRDVAKCATNTGYDISASCQGTVGQLVECFAARTKLTNQQFCAFAPIPACAWLDAC